MSFYSELKRRNVFRVAAGFDTLRFDQNGYELVWLQFDRFLDGLRDDPRFEELTTKATAQVEAARAANN